MHKKRARRNEQNNEKGSCGMNHTGGEFLHTLERDLKSLDALRELLVSFLIDGGLDERSVSMMELCCYEAVSNIIEHAGTSDIDNRIRLRCALGGGCVRCEIVHYGMEFDVTRVPMPDIRKQFYEGKSKGLGIYMIRTLVNDITYTHEQGKNILIMAIKYPTAGSLPG
jgi:serine/threonine-protein kinase RsbW